VHAGLERTSSEKKRRFSAAHARAMSSIRNKPPARGDGGDEAAGGAAIEIPRKLSVREPLMCVRVKYIQYKCPGGRGLAGPPRACWRRGSPRLRRIL
jgi:hypothetical protein